MEEAKLIKKFKRMFKCDGARITKPCGKWFLIIGFKRHTKDDAHCWYKNGQRVDFEYLAEHVIASGANEAELIASAKEYKRLQGMTMTQYLAERMASQATT